MRKVVPDIITTARFIAAVFLLHADATANAITPFWGQYAFCGLTDIADGYVARWLKAETKAGALLDSLADIFFVVCAAYKLYPVLMLPSWMWIWAAVIAGIKVINLVSALAVYGKPAFPHTLANKITGMMLFLCIPLCVCFGWHFTLIIVAAFATLAAMHEGHYIRTR